MTTKKTSSEKTSLATPNNLRLFNTVFPTLGTDISKDILDLLSKNPEPDEMINHYIEKERFDIARNLTNKFFSKEENIQREKYYMHIFTGVSNVLKKQVSSIITNDKKYEEIYFREDMISEIYVLGEHREKEPFYAALTDLCRELLEINTLFADKIVYSLREHFACEKGFVLILPAGLIKQKKYPTPFKQRDNMRVVYGPLYDSDRWERLDDTSQLSLSLSRKGYVHIGIDKK